MKFVNLIKTRSNINEDNIQTIVEDASYGLKIRRKGAKLSHDQIIFKWVK